MTDEQIKENSLIEFHKLLSTFDKFFEFSDDMSVYSDGQNKLKKLRELAKLSKMSEIAFVSYTDHVL